MTMTLTVRAVSLNDQPLTRAISARFDAAGGTIGRADHNTMALPDPERHISRQQAQIVAGADGYVIRNVGSANPISVGGQPLARNETAPLRPGDQLRMGRYLLEVSTDATAAPGPVPQAPLPSAPSPWFGDAPLSADNPFAALLGVVDAQRSAAPAAPLPHDFDPFARRPPRPASTDAPEPAAPGAFGDLVPGGRETAPMDLFGAPGDAGDRLAGFLSGAPAAPAAGPAAAAPQPDHTPDLHTAFQPPEVRAPAAEPPAAPAAADTPPAARSEGAADAALWRAFREGARIGLDPAPGLTPEMMGTIGALLRAAVEGSLQLMAVRATTKLELRADVTMIQTRNNNPLKFSPDAQSALEQMLQPPLRGFMPGPAAMKSAMHDLVGHAIGTMAGTRAALEGVLGRFAPAALEGKLSARSVLDSLLPINRKAKLWELYLQHFDAIRDEAQDDFDTLFGKAFLAAYEQQVERLKREQSAA